MAQKLINQSSCRPPSTPGRGFAFLLFALHALQRGYRDDSVRTTELSLFRLSPAGKEKHHGLFQRTLGLGLSLVFAYRKGKVLCPRKELPYLKAHNSMAVPSCTILSDETNGLTLTSSGCEWDLRLYQNLYPLEQVWSERSEQGSVFRNGKNPRLTHSELHVAPFWVFSACTSLYKKGPHLSLRAPPSIPLPLAHFSKPPQGPSWALFDYGKTSTLPLTQWWFLPLQKIPLEGREEKWGP